MIISIPEKVKFILDTIEKAGYEAYAVGGCVRDSILGKTPDDWDITTSAKPEEVKTLFRKTIDTGIEHGTVTVMIDKEGFEVTTYRIDGKYEDNRRPTEVIFTPCLEEDLKRRDFTINAMAYNESKGLVDIFGGMEDIKKGMIRCVGNPIERFNEDALRIMRAIRFSARLGYEIEEETKKAIRVLAPNLAKISAERVQVELVKLLTSKNPDYLRIAYETGVTAIVLPEFDKCMETEQKHPHHKYNVGEHILHSLLEVEESKVLRLAMLFHDIGKPGTVTVDEKGICHFHGHHKEGKELTREILKRLRFDNETLHMVCNLVYYHDYSMRVEPNKKNIRRAIYNVGEEAFPLLIQVMRADVLAQSDYKREEKLAKLDTWQELYQQILADKECVSLKTLAVTGKDLLENGVEQGKKVGEVLQTLLDHVLEHPEDNQKEILLSLINK